MGPSPGCRGFIKLTYTTYLDNVLVVNMNDRGQHKSEGLPRTSLSNSNHIPTRECDGPTLALDAGGLSEGLRD